MSFFKFLITAAIAAFSINSSAFTNCRQVTGSAALRATNTPSDLCYNAFGVRYNDRANGPDFAIMVIDPANQNKTPRTNNWHIDGRVANKDVLALFPVPDSKKYPDIKAFDKGHLVPADLMTNSSDMADSFSMPNEAPQYPGCNRGMWNKYERDTLLYAMRVMRPITVITGVKYGVLATNGSPSIPTHYWKLVIDGDKMFAFILPNDPVLCSQKTNPTGNFSPVTYQELTEFIGYRLLKIGN